MNRTNYINGLRYVYENGVMRGDRTGKGRHSVFSPPDERYLMSQGIPLDTTREIKPGAAIDELLWFISGSSNIDTLNSKFFWKKWAVTEEQFIAYYNKYSPLKEGEAYSADDERLGSIGKMYGNLWRNAPAPVGKHCLPVRTIDDLPWDSLEVARKRFSYTTSTGSEPVFDDVSGFKRWLANHTDPFSSKQRIIDELIGGYWNKFDQLNELIVNLKLRPFSSRHRVTAAFPQFTAFEDFSISENIMDGRAALTPCHTFLQCYVTAPEKAEDKAKLSLKLYMSSNDYPVGRVYNIFQYSLLLCMIAQCVGMEPHEFIISTGDGHIYSDQLPFLEEHLSREPFAAPRLWLNPEIKDITQFTKDDIKILDYKFHPEIKYPVAV